MKRILVFRQTSIGGPTIASTRIASAQSVLPPRANVLWIVSRQRNKVNALGSLVVALTTLISTIESN